MEPGPEVVGTGTVLESRTHGPQLCLGMVQLSLPPQGGGVPITNWDWSAVSGWERRSGTTWGHYTVVGTFDGRTLTMTRPPTVPVERPPDPADLHPPCTPCPPPEGGWRVVDASRATDDDLEATAEAASRLDGFARLWWDQSINPASLIDDEEGWDAMNDPEKLILNVAVTHDPEAAERILRTTWGGALCVSVAARTEAELDAIGDALMVELLEDLRRGGTVVPLGIDVGHESVDLEVEFDDGSLQERVDREHGVGLVRVVSRLQPFTG